MTIRTNWLLFTAGLSSCPGPEPDPDTDTDFDADTDAEDTQDTSDTADSGDTAAPEPLEIIGTYSDNWGGDHIISAETWEMDGGLLGFHIAYYDNGPDFLVAQNDENNPYLPNAWSRFDWTGHEGGLWYCQIAHDAATEEDAAAVEDADRFDPPTGGCAGFAWTELIPDAT